MACPRTVTRADLVEMIDADPLLALVLADPDLTGLMPRRGRAEAFAVASWTVRELARACRFLLDFGELEVSRRRLRIVYGDLLELARPGHGWPPPHELEPDRQRLDELAARFARGAARGPLRPGGVHPRPH